MEGVAATEHYKSCNGSLANQKTIASSRDGEQRGNPQATIDPSGAADEALVTLVYLLA